MEERAAIKLFHDKGYDPATIIKKLADLNISKMKVYRTVKRLRETGSIEDRKRSGRPRSVRTTQLISKVRSRYWRKSQQSVNKMAHQLKISRSSLNRVVKEELGLRPYKKRKIHGLTRLQEKKRLERSKVLLERYADEKLDEIIFSDEKLFGVEERFNKQNDRIYALSIEDIPEYMRTVQRFQK